MKNKKWIILIIVFILLLAVPLPTGVYKDGGTKTYTALTYKIVDWNRLSGADGVYSKTKIYPFPLNFFSIDRLWEREKVEGKAIPNVVNTDPNIKDIIDETKNSNISIAQALELFYSDETYDYYFSSIKSQYVIVNFKDGTKKTVKEALKNNEITIADLDAFKIEYSKKAKEIEPGVNPYFNAEVLQVHEKSILVKPDADSKEIKSADKISVSLDFIAKIRVPKINVGDRVRVIYNGNIAESYPAQINGVFVVYLLAQDGSVISPTPQAEQSTYSENTQTTIKKDGKQYTFKGEDSVRLTNLLRRLIYDRDICKCLPDYIVDTEFGSGYGIKLIKGDSYVRYNGKQANITDEQVKIIEKNI